MYPKTCHNIFLTLHVSLEAAVKDRLLPRNPADDAHKLGKDDHREMQWWSEDELNRFLAFVADDSLYAMWHVFGWTGARRGEVAAMRWRDVDLDAGTWTIAVQWKKGRDGKPEMSPTKSKAGRRTIALVPETVEVLRRHRADQNRLRLMLGSDYVDNGLVHCLPNGEPMHPDGVTQRFDRHVRNAGARRIRLHDVRHTHATWCLKNVMPVHVLSARLGHASIQTTVDLYGHSDTEMQHDALGAALRRAQGE